MFLEAISQGLFTGLYETVLIALKNYWLQIVAIVGVPFILNQGLKIVLTLFSNPKTVTLLKAKNEEIKKLLDNTEEKVIALIKENTEIRKEHQETRNEIKHLAVIIESFNNAILNNETNAEVKYLYEKEVARLSVEKEEIQEAIALEVEPEIEITEPEVVEEVKVEEPKKKRKKKKKKPAPREIKENEVYLE